MLPGDNVRLSVGEPNEHCLTIECLLDIPWIYHSYTFSVFTTPDLTAFQADMKRATGAVRLDLELPKPFRVSAVAPETIERSVPPDSVWLEYVYRKHHPVLQYLPTKLAEWIGEKVQDDLGLTRETRTSGVYPSSTTSCKRTW